MFGESSALTSQDTTHDQHPVADRSMQNLIDALAGRNADIALVKDGLEHLAKVLEALGDGARAGFLRSKLAGEMSTIVNSGASKTDHSG